MSTAMLLVLLFLTHLSLGVEVEAADDPDNKDHCFFEAYQPTSINEVMECYNSINHDTDKVKTTTCDNIIKYLDLNVFSEYYMDTEKSKMDKALNIKQEVEKIKGKSYKSEYHFHWDMVQLMLKLKDAHSVYRFPSCFTSIYYVLPFAFNSRVEEKDGVQKIYLSSLPSEYSFATVYYQNNKDNFEGARELLEAVSSEMEVQDMKITYDNTYYDEEEYTDLECLEDEDYKKCNPVTIIKNWADRHEYISRNSAARFNSAIRTNLYLHKSAFGVPFYNISIKVGGVWFKNIPWLAIPTQTIGGKNDLLRLSPLKSESSDDYIDTRNMDPETRAEYLREVRQAAQKRMLATIMEKPPTPMTVQRDYDNSTNQRKETVRGFVKGYARKHSNRYYDSDVVDEDSTLERIYVGDGISLRLYRNNTEKVRNKTNSDGTARNAFEAFVISIPTFSPSDIDQFTKDLQEIFDYIYANVDSNNTTIIIDLRENGGGYIDLGNKLLYYLASADVDPNSSGLYMRKKCDLNDYIADNEHMSGIDGDPLYDFYSHSSLDSDKYYKKGETWKQDFNNEANKSGKVSVEYVRDYTFDPLDFYDFSGQRRSDKGDSYNSNLKLKYYFEVNDKEVDTTGDTNKYSVLVVTDGTCGSTCATFLNHAIEMNAVTVIGVGGLEKDIYQDGEKYNFLAASSFAGGSVSDSNEFEALFDDWGISQDSSDDAKDIVPSKMPRDNYIRFPYNALMSFRDKDVAMEFEQYPVTYRVPYFVPLGLSVTDSIKHMLDFVIPEILSDGESSPANNSNSYIEIESGDSDDKKRYGYFYDPQEKKFNKPKEPVVVGCKAGFYPEYEYSDGDKSVMNMQVKKCKSLEETQISTGSLGWVSILFICLAVVFCILVLVFWIVRRQQGKRFGDTGFTKECCCPCCFKNKMRPLESDANDPLLNVEVSSHSDREEESNVPSNN